MTPLINWGSVVTNPSYQFFSASNVLLGSPVTTGQVARGGFLVWPAATPPSGAIGIQYSCSEFDPEFGGIDASLSAEAIAALEGADGILLEELYTPTGQPAIIIPAPENDAQLSGTLYTYDGEGNIQPYIPVHFELISTAYTGAYQKAFTLTSNANGAIGAYFLKSSKYRGRRGFEPSAWKEFTTNTGPTYEIPAIIGK